MVICIGNTKHTFRVYLPEAQRVELAGTFTNWRAQSVAMKREDTGWWTATLELAPGDHDFSYLVNASTWIADYAASGVKRNGFGGWVSQIHVAEPATNGPLAVQLRSASAPIAA